MVEEVNNYENIDFNENNLSNLSEFNKKIKKSGVIYLSRIPIGMTIPNLRKLLEKYEIKRIYLVPFKEKKFNDFGKKVQAYKEGWVEFEDKILAKLCEFQLNGKPIGGKKNCSYKDDLWTIKYLHKFKWHHLTEKLNYNKNLREKRIKNEIRQGKRENEFMVKMFEKSKLLNKKREKENENNENENNENNENENENEENENNNNEIDNENEENELEKIRKKFKQKKPIIKNNNK
jgi:ESF2/ABP1 family protein